MVWCGSRVRFTCTPPSRTVRARRSTSWRKAGRRGSPISSSPITTRTRADRCRDTGTASSCSWARKSPRTRVICSASGCGRCRSRWRGMPAECSTTFATWAARRSWRTRPARVTTSRGAAGRSADPGGSRCSTWTACGDGRPGSRCSGGCPPIRSIRPTRSRGASTARTTCFRAGMRCFAGARSRGWQASTHTGSRRTAICFVSFATTSSSTPRSRQIPSAMPPR